MDKLFINYSGNIESFKRLGLEETYKKRIVFIEKDGAIYTHNAYYAGPNVIKSIQEALNELQLEVMEGDYVSSIKQVNGKIEATMGTFEERDSKILRDSKSYTDTFKESLTRAIALEYVRATEVEKNLSERINNHLTIAEAELSSKADKDSVYDKDQIDLKLTGVYKIKGSCTFENLPETNKVGDVYNITNSFTLDGEEYTAGTNIVYTENGWDTLAGIFDTSELESEILRLSDSLAQESVRAVKAEIDLEDKIGEYLPLSGGTLTGKTYAKDRIILSDGLALQFENKKAYNTEKLLLPYSSKNYELSYLTNNEWNIIWHEGNDGEGSGLDADTLDGKHLTDFLHISDGEKIDYDLNTTPVNKISSISWDSSNRDYIYNKPENIIGGTIFTVPGTKGFQLYQGYEQNELKFRGRYNHLWYPWKKIAFTDSDITGNSAGASILIGDELKENLDLNNLTDWSGIRFWKKIPDNSVNGPTFSGWSNSMLQIPLHGTSSKYAQLYFSSGRPLYYRSEHTADWKEIATTDSNVASATKLQTPVKLWGNDFDGSSDVSGYISRVTTIYGSETQAPYLQLSSVPLNGTNLGGAIGIGVAPDNYGIFAWGTNDGDGHIQVGRKDGTGEGVSNYNLILLQFGGNISIGTTNTGHKLSVYGRIYGNMYNAFNSSAGAALMLNKGGDYFGIGPSSVKSTMSFGAVEYAGTWKSEFMSMSAEGNIGIGTTDPQHKLDVNGGVRVVDELRFLSADGIYDGAILLINTGDMALHSTKIGLNYTNIIMALNGGNVGIGTNKPIRKFVISDSGKNGIEINPYDTDSTIITYNRETNEYTPLTVLCSAFGIGTLSPKNKLDVNGSIRASNGLYLSNNNSIFMQDTSKNDLSTMHMNTLNNLIIGQDIASSGFSTFIDGSAVHLRYSINHLSGFILNESGNVTIGNSNLAGNSYKLYVDGLLHTNSLSIQSDTKVDNLNADKLDGYEAEDFALKSDVEIEVENGVYIVDLNGTLHDPNTFVGTADDVTGIGLVTDNGKWIVALDEWYSDSESTAWNGNIRSAWGGYGTEVIGCFLNSSESAAMLDFNGEANTDAIIAQLKDTTDENSQYYTGAPAAEYCRAYSKGYKDVGSWYLPAAGELNEIVLNKDAINAILTKLGKNNLSKNSYTWSSSQYLSDAAWYYYWSPSFWTYRTKGYDRGVRPICKLELEIKKPLKEKVSEIETTANAALSLVNKALSTASDALSMADSAESKAAKALSTANKKQDRLVSGTNIKTINGESILGSGDIKVIINNVTYSELVTLRNNSQLVPGKQYRITDYITTTIQAETQSAGHLFDIIVTADTVNILNETARITNHEGDTYFANENLAAFLIKYCLDNDTTRFSWADTANGKGVIYYMKDQHNNETPYDFKNIQFKRYKVLLNNEYCVDYKSYIENDYVGFKPMNSTGASMYTDLSIANESDFKWYYTFSRLTDETDASINSEGKVHDNVILPVVEDDDNLETHALNNIVFISDMIVSENKFNDCCFLMTFISDKKDLYCNYIGSYSRGNILKNCLQNYISNNFQRSIIMSNNAYSNTIGLYFTENIAISPMIIYNDFGDSYRNNTSVAVKEISNNKFYTECHDNIIVTTGVFNRNHTKAHFLYNVINCSNFSVNTIEFGFSYNMITGGNFVQNIIGHMCQYNTFGDHFMNSVIGTYFMNNTFKTGIDTNSEYRRVSSCYFGLNIRYNNFYNDEPNTNYIKNLKVQSELKGTESAINNIEVPCNAINEVNVVKKDNGDIVVFSMSLLLLALNI